MESNLLERMRPINFTGFFGQKHLISKNKPLSIIIKNGINHSMVFYGPPATGKTSFAKILASHFDYNFIYSNALTLNSNDIRSIIEGKTAANNLFPEKKKKNILFIDEFHRLNKPKQDSLLEPIEKNQIIIIGATTENPFFVLQPALRSRIFIYEFYDLDEEDLGNILDYALSNDEILMKYSFEFEKNAKKLLIKNSMDARKLLNTLEILFIAKKENNDSGKIFISIQDCIDFFGKNSIRYAQSDSIHDAISAFIKSVRGSDPDAAVYYLALMLENGEDPLYISRRLIILASEDIGLAYPEALSIATSCYEAVKVIGLPESRIILSQVTLLFSLLPKSNSSYLAIDSALEFIKSGNILKIPDHLKGRGENLLKKYFSVEQGREKSGEYIYPHNYPKHFTRQKYLEYEKKFYTPVALGFEKKLMQWIKILYDERGTNSNENI